MRMLVCQYFEGKVMACLGRDVDTCYEYSFENNSWTEGLDLGPSRYSAGSTLVDGLEERLPFFWDF